MARRATVERKAANDARIHASKTDAPTVRVNDAEATRANILEVALREFADKGLSGARIDEIANLTRTSKRMIYYYFESKEGLYKAVLEESYRGIRRLETELDLDDLPPLEALRRLALSTFDYQCRHQDFVRLVMVENIHHGRHVGQLAAIEAVNSAAIEQVKRICQRGAEAGVMRSPIDPIDLHMSISALSFFNVSNRHTFSRIFTLDMASEAYLAARRESVAELIVRSVAL